MRITDNLIPSNMDIMNPEAFAKCLLGDERIVDFFARIFMAYDRVEAKAPSLGLGLVFAVIQALNSINVYFDVAEQCSLCK